MSSCACALRDDEEQSTRAEPVFPQAQARAVMATLIAQKIASGDAPSVVAEVVVSAATATRPKLRYAAGSVASRLRWLRKWAPAGMMDSGIRKDFQLDALPSSRSRSPVLAPEKATERS